MKIAANPRVASDLIWRMSDDSAVIVLPRTGELKVLNSSGTIIWQLLVKHNSITSILDYIVDTTDVAYEQAEKDLRLFLNELTEKQVLVWDA